MSETTSSEESLATPAREGEAVGDITFHNVTLTFEGMTGKEAYNAFCAALGAIPGCEWETDTYTGPAGTGSTSDLFPPMN